MKKYNIFSNLAYVCKTINKWDKTAIIMFLIVIAITPVLRIAEMSFAPAIIYLIEKGFAIPQVLLGVLGLTVCVMLSAFIYVKANKKVMQKKSRLYKHFEIIFAEKIMDIDFELIEGPAARNIYQRANNSIKKSGPENLIYNFTYLVSQIALILSIGGIIATLEPLIIVYLIITQLAALGISLLSDKLVDKTKEPQAVIDRKLNYLTKNARDFSAAKDIRLYRLRDQFKALSEYFIGEKQFWTNKVYLYYFISDLGLVFGSIFVEGGAYGFLAYKLLKSDISGAELILYFSAMLSFGNYLKDVGSMISATFEANLCTSDYRNFIEIKNSTVNSGGTELPKGNKFTFNFENVSFKYPGSERMILDNISFTWESGEKLALVGLNGAGKTTLVKLICGLYKPTGGVIRLNGTDISEFNRDEYFTLISAVFQDARVLPETIGGNISLKDKEHTDYELLKSCIKKAGLDRRIEKLEDKENTLLVKSVNENAVELSGGEYQKLLLARALYKNAPVIILDEPTAALDPIAENEMYLKYDSFTSGKTSLYISHRLSSTRFCDRIVFLSDGKFAEIGTHDELMNQGGKYAELYDIQSKYYKEDGERNEA